MRPIRKNDGQYCGRSIRPKWRCVKRATLLTIACLTVLMTFGCKPAPPPPSAPSAPFELPTRHVSIPTMRFFAASDIPDGDRIRPGDKLPAGNYRPYLGGEHITSFQWIADSARSQPFTALMTLDASGTADLARWSSANRGASSVIVLGDTVIAVGPFARPVTDGQLYVGGADFTAQRALIESAMLPIQ